MNAITCIRSVVGLYVLLNPSAMKASNQTEWSFPAGVVRTPEPVAPNLKSRSNIVTVDATFGTKASGVLYALGGMSGGLRHPLIRENSLMSTTLSTMADQDQSQPSDTCRSQQDRSRDRDELTGARRTCRYQFFGLTVRK